jgi:hypothetical protein
MNAVLALSPRAVAGLLRSPSPTVSGRMALLWAIVFGLAHGGLIGTFTGLWEGRPLQIVYSALKLPLLLVLAFVVALPSFFVLNTLAGVRGDWPAVLRNLVASQAGLVVVLTALGPLLIVWYASSDAYAAAVMVNALLFLIAGVTSQQLLRRWYRPLEARAPVHQLLRWAWLVIYGFVGIQMGYVLRPFIGSPGAEVTFFREEAWGNAYLVVFDLFLGALRGG